jgi:hypothetical protein
MSTGGRSSTCCRVMFGHACSGRLSWKIRLRPELTDHANPQRLLVTNEQ